MFAAVSSPAIVVAFIVCGFAFRRMPGWRKLAIFSFAISVGFVVVAPAAIIATATKSDLAGLAERVPIGLSVLWLLVVGPARLGSLKAA